MAHSLSARKRVRQNTKSKLRNRRRTATLKASVKSYLGLVHGGKLEEAEKALPKVCKTIDQTAAKGTIHKNAAARYKSRLTKRLNTAKTPKAA